MIINSVKIILLIFVSSIFHSCNGQLKSEHQNYETETIEIGKVVSEIDNQIWKIFQDSKGKYWFGSNGRGVYKLDGNKLKLFTTKDGLVDNAIRGPPPPTNRPTTTPATQQESDKTRSTPPTRSAPKTTPPPTTKTQKKKEKNNHTRTPNKTKEKKTKAFTPKEQGARVHNRKKSNPEK